jgi:hypothetical protein
MAKGERDLPKLTAEQVRAHERFAWMEITMKELQRLAQSSISFSSARVVQLTMSDGEFTP